MELEAFGPALIGSRQLEALRSPRALTFYGQRNLEGPPSILVWQLMVNDSGYLALAAIQTKFR